MFGFCTPEQSEAMHLEILAIEEEIFQGLGLAYHVLDTCTGDLGGPAYRKYDLEAWMPCRGEIDKATGRQGRIWRSHQHLELHRLPGPPAEHPLQGGGPEGHALRPHPQRHGRGRHAGARRHSGELSAGGWLGSDSRSAPAVGWQRVIKR